MSCYVVDFGISLRQKDLERLTKGSPVGTPGYMSPEQDKGEELDQTTDIFSLGIVLYECLLRVPAQSEHPFRSNVNTHSGAI